tara:strand:+ start:457 stop:954 length:498 start_codon:yes stop_codon:yes gene_type:complete
MGELRNLLKSISFGDLQGSQINDAGKIAFADIMASRAVQEIIDIGNAWKTVTLPSYGAIVPQTCEVLMVELEEGSGTILAPTGNQVYEIQGFSFVETSGGSATIDVYVTDSTSANEFRPFTSESLSSGQRKSAVIKNFRIDSNCTLYANVAGTAQINVLVGKVAL